MLPLLTKAVHKENKLLTEKWHAASVFQGNKNTKISDGVFHSDITSHRNVVAE